MADEPKPEGAEPAAGQPEPAKPAEPKPAAAKPAAPAKPPAAPAAHAPPKPPPPMAATPWESDLTKQLKEQFGDRISEFSTYLGQNFLICKPDASIPILEFLKLEADFDYLVDITAVDYPKRPERFDLFYILYSFARNERIRIKTAIADGAKPATATTVHATANWLEREVFDMFGIQFEGHPDMRRILLPEEWEGFPLRKEYGLIQQDDRWVKENLNIESGQ
jgi:NADH-quinone oxidoreductase subunit C